LEFGFENVRARTQEFLQAKSDWVYQQ
jgi:hypothetical protein